MPVELPTSALRLAVDRDALAGNWAALNQLSGHADAAAAVKADAYGVGARFAVPVLRVAGCRYFYVAHWAEAAALIDLVPPTELAVLHGPMTASDIVFARATGVRPVINSLAQARLWLDAGGGICDVMVDSGINRLGLPMRDLGDELLAQLDVDVAMSHLACADEDHAMNAEQLARWHEARSHVTHRRASLANSAGIVLGAAYHGDLTRPGLALYGGIPRPELAAHIRQVVRPQAVIMQVRHVAAGETIGYNATFTAPAAMRVGVIALGYADGYLRCWSGAGQMLAVDGQILPVLGRVSMDMTVIDLSHAPQVVEGDWVEVGYNLPDAAKESGLSQYELLTLMGQRFWRE
ncbi:MAG: hypothetical protein RLY97_438 [Pseudomonadota bacterium]